MNPIVSINSSTGIPLSTVTFLKACSDISGFAGTVCPAADAIFNTQTAIDAMDPGLRLLLVVPNVPTYSPKGPSFPEMALDRIDTIFFSHVPVGRSIRPFTPETFLDLL
jgi:hypothetical protein